MELDQIAATLLQHLCETTVERNQARAALVKQSADFEARLAELEVKIAEAAPPARKRTART